MSNEIKLIKKSYVSRAGRYSRRIEFTITLSKEKCDALVLLLGELTRREEENKGLSEKQTELIYQVYKDLVDVTA